MIVTYLFPALIAILAAAIVALELALYPIPVTETPIHSDMLPTSMYLNPTWDSSYVIFKQGHTKLATVCEYSDASSHSPLILHYNIYRCGSDAVADALEAKSMSMITEIESDERLSFTLPTYPRPSAASPTFSLSFTGITGPVTAYVPVPGSLRGQQMEVQTTFESFKLDAEPWASNYPNGLTLQFRPKTQSQRGAIQLDGMPMVNAEKLPRECLDTSMDIQIVCSDDFSEDVFSLLNVDALPRADFGSDNSWGIVAVLQNDLTGIDTSELTFGIMMVRESVFVWWANLACSAGVLVFLYVLIMSLMCCCFRKPRTPKEVRSQGTPIPIVETVDEDSERHLLV